MTYRERREAKADRLDLWAANRTSEATATLERDRQRYSGDTAFNTQPGHIPERARMIARTDRAFESLNKAQGMASRAANIRGQLDESIYTDDPDAIDRLTERIAALEAQREQYKAHNKAKRGGKTCPHPPTCDCHSVFARCKCTEHPLPAYVLTNLSGNIKRNRDRLEMLKREAAKPKPETGGVIIRAANWPGYIEVAFAEKPDRETIDALKARGFRWNKIAVAWVGTDTAFAESLVS